jgi:hypothetical protein
MSIGRSETTNLSQEPVKTYATLDHPDDLEVGAGTTDTEPDEVDAYVPGDSTSFQTVCGVARHWCNSAKLIDQFLNTTGDMIGTGLLACPIAFARLGWVMGAVLMVSMGLASIWT